MQCWWNLLIILLLATPLKMMSSDDIANEGDEDFIDPFDMEKSQIPKKVTTPSPPTGQKVSSEVKNPSSKSTVKPNEVPPKKNPIESQTPTPRNKSACNCTRPDSSKILFQNYVKFFLGKFRGKLPQSSTEEFNMLLRLSPEDVKNLELFSSGKSANVHDAHEILTAMLKGITRSHVGRLEKISAWFQDKFGVSLLEVIKVLTVISLVFIIMGAGINITLTWRQFVLKAMILAFLISIPMTWYELFKAAEIQQQTVAMKDAPAECIKEKEDFENGMIDSWFGVAQSAFRGLFTFEKDNCQKYYENMLINPFLKVPPTKALAVTFVRFFVSPLKDVGEAFGEFLRALLIDLPVTLYPIAILAVALFFFLFLFMWMGYSIRLPFFLSIEPGQVTVTGGDTGAKEAIEEKSKDLQDQIKALQDTLQSQEEKMMERMVHMEKIQMAALEYSTTYQQHQGAGDARPPTLSQMSIEAPKLDTEHVVPNSIAEHRPDSNTVNFKSPIPCSDVDDAGNWTQTTNEDIVEEEDTVVKTVSDPTRGEGANETQDANEVVTLKPACVVNNDKS